jgi:hypothetical protein
MTDAIRVEYMLLIAFKSGDDVFILVLNVAYDALLIRIGLAQGVKAYLL